MRGAGRRESLARMTYAFVIGRTPSPSLSALCDQLDAELRDLGWTKVENSDDAPTIITRIVIGTGVRAPDM